MKTRCISKDTQKMTLHKCIKLSKLTNVQNKVNMTVHLQWLLTPLDTLIGGLRQTSCAEAQGLRGEVKPTAAFVKEGVKIIRGLSFRMLRHHAG